MFVMMKKMLRLLLLNRHCMRFFFFFSMIFSATAAKEDVSCDIVIEQPIILYNYGFENRLVFNYDSLNIKSLYGFYNYDKHFLMSLDKNIMHSNKNDLLIIKYAKNTDELTTMCISAVWTNIPLPEVTIFGFESDQLSYNCVRNIRHLDLIKTITDSRLDFTVNIISFCVNVHDQGVSKTLCSSSHLFTIEQKKAIANIGVGSFFYIDEVVITLPWGKEKMPDIKKYYIVE
jgi:hypothetical protein